MSYEVFRDDLRTTYAVIRCLEIISEASRRLPDDLKARHPAIALKNMAAAGNIYRHDYEDVAASFVWLCRGITCQRCVPSSSRSWRPSTNHDLRRSETGRQFRVENGHSAIGLVRASHSMELRQATCSFGALDEFDLCGMFGKLAESTILQIAIAHLDPLILDDLKKSAERPALRYGLSKAGHERG